MTRRVLVVTIDTAPAMAALARLAEAADRSPETIRAGMQEVADLIRGSLALRLHPAPPRPTATGA